MTKHKLLLVEDDKTSREILSEILEGLANVEVITATNANEAMKIFESENLQFILTDIKMPGESGVDLLAKIRSSKTRPDAKVALLTGCADAETAAGAIKFNADEYLYKPIDVKYLCNVVNNWIREAERNVAKSAITRKNSSRENYVDKALVESQAIYEKGAFISVYRDNIKEKDKIGIFSKQMKEIVSTALKLHREPDIPVLLEGESGTGKEIIARLVHHGRDFDEKPFVSLNCSAISPGLFESELFGYERGAFTGSRAGGGKGKLELAGDGTIFFDEIASTPLELQPKLLRAIEEKSFYRVGGAKKIDFKARIISATNENLSKLVRQRKFRLDLYHRINAGMIKIPPLREQKDAIAPLSQMFLIDFSKKRRRRFKAISKSAADTLRNSVWLGNARELKNAIDRVTLLYDELEVTREHLNFLDDYEEIQSDKPPLSVDNFSLPESGIDIKDFEHKLVRKVLSKFGGNKTRTANYLGLTLSSLRSRIR